MSEKRQRINWLIWHITNACNLSCTYCFTSSAPGIKHGLDQEGLLDIAAQINTAGCELITIIGGEPLAVKPLPQIVERLLNLEGRRINIDTNGNYLRSRWSDVYRSIERFNITLDDVEESIHDKLRGGYQGVLSGIELLKEKQMRFSGNITLTRHNLKNLRKTAEFLAHNGANVVGFNAVKK